MANVRSEARIQTAVADIRRLLERHRLLDALAGVAQPDQHAARGQLEAPAERNSHHAHQPWQLVADA